MNKEQVLTAMRKNWLSITLGVVALVAIGLMLFPIASWRQGVHSEVQARAAKGDEISTLLGKSRPGIDVNTSGSRPGDTQLAMFPTEKVIQEGRRTIDGVVQQANRVLEIAVEVNRRVPLGFESYEQAAEVWPLTGPRKSGERDRFRQLYSTWINASNAFSGESGDYPQGTLQAELGGTRPPTAEEIKAADVALEATLRSRLDEEQFNRELPRARVEQANAVKVQRARTHLMYVDVNSGTVGLTVHPVATAETVTAEDCFNAQMGLWVQETVARNLKRANEQMASQLQPEARNLTNLPVKHLVAINVPVTIAEAAPPEDETREDGTPTGGAGGGVRGGAFGGAGQGAGSGTGSIIRRGGSGAGTGTDTTGGEEAPAEEEAGVELPVEPGATIERNFGLSPSGRPLHTPLYDTVQFNVTVRCDASNVPFVITELQRNSLITVLKLDMTAVDPLIAAQQGYYYGERPVVELDLQCEMMFLRPWTVPLMPDGIRQALLSTGEEGADGGDDAGGDLGGF